MKSFGYLFFSNLISYKGLFWAAITQSGSALCDWAVEEDPYSYTKLLSSSLGCRVEESSRSIVDCLRRRSATEIVTTQQKLLVSLRTILS